MEASLSGMAGFFRGSRLCGRSFGLFERAMVGMSFTSFRYYVQMIRLLRLCRVEVLAHSLSQANIR